MRKETVQNGMLEYDRQVAEAWDDVKSILLNASKESDQGMAGHYDRLEREVTRCLAANGYPTTLAGLRKCELEEPKLPDLIRDMTALLRFIPRVRTALESRDTESGIYYAHKISRVVSRAHHRPHEPFAASGKKSSQAGRKGGLSPKRQEKTNVWHPLAITYADELLRNGMSPRNIMTKVFKRYAKDDQFPNQRSSFAKLLGPYLKNKSST